MEIRLFQIDAFSERLFSGNPAAVCPLDAWLDDDVLQKIAAENNLSETAFFVKMGQGFHLRWFTPVCEVRLCGHATLASAHVLFHHLGYPGKEITFETLSGSLNVSRDGEWISMDFPNQEPVPCAPPPRLLQAFGLSEAICLKREDYFLILENEEAVVNARPDLDGLRALDLRGVGISARGKSHDFVSRFFAPKYGIDEDPVTGSAHTQLAPYWSKIIGRDELLAKQVSKRGGEIKLRVSAERVLISGKAVTYLAGTLSL
ncbi:MAG: PhzF family phenazine biosynthesis protein [Fibrobacteria bacterium]